ncbi:MAG: MBL fold metallo-hydrolase [Bacilli bacterium]
MEIKTIPVGPLQANCYILINNQTCLIIDPGDEYQKIINNIDKLKPLAILVTHNHFDHIGAIKKLTNLYKIETYDFSNMIEKKYSIESFQFEVIFTPGHSNDSVTYYFENIMFTGDFLFKGTIGRTDLTTGNMQAMETSINKIKQYKHITIYPGHGEKTTLALEKENNYYFK